MTPDQNLSQGVEVHPLERVWARIELEASMNTDDVAAECGLIGVRDGFSEAIQLLDLLTGGDGEYRFSTFPERSCPTPVEMGMRIIERLSQPAPQPAGEVVEREAVVAWLREKVAPCRNEAIATSDDDEISLEWQVRANTYEFAANQVENGIHRLGLPAGGEG